MNYTMMLDVYNLDVCIVVPDIKTNEENIV